MAKLFAQKVQKKRHLSSKSAQIATIPPEIYGVITVICHFNQLVAFVFNKFGSHA